MDRRAPLGLVALALACAGPRSDEVGGPAANEPEPAAPGRVPVRSAADPKGPLPAGVERIDFARLALPAYLGEPVVPGTPRPSREECFPADVLALEGRWVALDGYMMPIAWADDGQAVAAFVLSPFVPNCLQGSLPRMDEYIEATVLGDEGVPWLAYRAVRVIGALQVGEEFDEYGYVTSVYRLDVDRVDLL